ncbi:MAG: NADH-quinone oxidoreductase subunit C [Pirellulaceae bacterium]|nr:NADH-quinone oxidoreductase subunit C [Planctomycetales bacterium]MCA9163571.1 NADH-quinone oxidoreductase subunit C [Planctomycetales bacterium]MCA9202045.1 NADH-quinone oxidoreductase subunit C [Planctomycetales bacterium]MCA9226068.1 NADH-quinone oxidoreductase subunit C [Planctomycetales bacterium]
MNEAVIKALRERFGELVVSEFRGSTRVIIGKDALLAAMSMLKTQHGFDMLVDVTCVDYLNYRDATDRFGLVYLLANTVNSDRLTVRVMLNEPDLTVPSMFELWEGADWMEREVWDMFGIHFEGHPDHRRILMPQEFTAFPLRKDYPLQGRGERHNFPVIRRAQA